jgi:hypothetical protein
MVTALSQYRRLKIAMASDPTAVSGLSVVVFDSSGVSLALNQTSQNQNMKLLKKMLLVGSVLAMAGTPAMGAFTFTNGDLILGFQATAGQGNTTNVFFNLGSGTGLRDNPAQGLLGNISSSLTSAFGSNWYSRTDVWFGVMGNLNNTNPAGANPTAPVDGDPSRTVYLSSAASSPGSGSLRTAGTFGSTTLGQGTGNFNGLENILLSPNLTNGAGETRILTQAGAPVEWNNSWSAWNPTPGAAFNVFTGGIQQNFGKGTSSTYADVQRILATNTGANPTGVVGGGTYEFTVAIGSDGSISAIPEVSSTLLLGAIGLAAAFQRRRFRLA